MKLNDLFKNTSYEDTLFSEEAILAVESAVFMKNVKNVDMPYIKCLIRDKEIKLTPEEAIRQLYIYKLIHEYDYPISRIQLETPIHFGREVKRADITIMDKDRPLVPYIIVELKKPKLTDGKEQLKSYCNATGAPIGVWTNGEQVSCYNRKDPNFFEMISDIPKASQKLSDILNEKYTYDDLRSRDKISKEKRSLRNLIKEMEDEVLASAGVDSFEEIIFKKNLKDLQAALVNAAIVTQERDGINQQISFSEIAINNPKRVAEGDYRVTHYKVQRTNEKISTLVHKKNDPTTIYFQFEQKKYDETELDVHADFLRLGIEQQGQCKAFYKEICPYVIESVLTRDKDNKVEFIAERSQVSRGIIEVLYLLRCSLMHGEVFPDNNAMEVYKYAYSILAAILKKMF